jgi:hypothetical protein
MRSMRHLASLVLLCGTLAMGACQSSTPNPTASAWQSWVATNGPHLDAAQAATSNLSNTSSDADVIASLQDTVTALDAVSPPPDSQASTMLATIQEGYRTGLRFAKEGEWSKAKEALTRAVQTLDDFNTYMDTKLAAAGS